LDGTNIFSIFDYNFGRDFGFLARLFQSLRYPSFDRNTRRREKLNELSKKDNGLYNSFTMKPTSFVLGKSIRQLMSCTALILLASCASVEKSRYFNNIMDTQIEQMNTDYDPIIQKADILSITVSSLNAEDSKIFNAPNNPSIGGTPTQSGPAAFGYLVGPDGNITFPVLGNLKAAGITKRQLTDTITSALVRKKLLLDPIVIIRSLNFRVTVLGEVGRPGVVPVPNEKISILEAIGMAGDMTISARRDNVLLIREDEGKKIIRRLNLNSEEIFRSQYFYLKSNDVVYIETNKAKVQGSSRLTTLLPVLLSALAFIAVIFTQVKL